MVDVLIVFAARKMTGCSVPRFYHFGRLPDWAAAYLSAQKVCSRKNNSTTPTSALIKSTAFSCYILRDFRAFAPKNYDPLASSTRTKHYQLGRLRSNTSSCPASTDLQHFPSRLQCVREKMDTLLYVYMLFTPSLFSILCLHQTIPDLVTTPEVPILTV